MNKFNYINLKNVENPLDLFDKLSKMNFTESHINNVNKCPYLIVHKDFDTQKMSIYQNLSETFLNILKSKIQSVEFYDVDKFLEEALTIV